MAGSKRIGFGVPVTEGTTLDDIKATAAKVALKAGWYLISVIDTGPQFHINFREPDPVTGKPGKPAEFFLVKPGRAGLPCKRC